MPHHPHSSTCRVGHQRTRSVLLSGLPDSLLGSCEHGPALTVDSPRPFGGGVFFICGRGHTRQCHALPSTLTGRASFPNTSARGCLKTDSVSAWTPSPRSAARPWVTLPLAGLTGVAATNGDETGGRDAGGALLLPLGVSPGNVAVLRPDQISGPRLGVLRGAEASPGSGGDEPRSWLVLRAGRGVSPGGAKPTAGEIVGGESCAAPGAWPGAAFSQAK